MDNRRSYTTRSCPNGLSDHDGQILTLLNLPISPKSIKHINTIKFDNNTVTDFQIQLSYEQWEDVFGNNNINEIFNNFLNTYLRSYYSSYNKKKTKIYIKIIIG
jgi:ASC-1-like (ASCH) protein